MPDVKVSLPVLAERLFGAAKSEVRVEDVRFDASSGTAILRISGNDVPDVDCVSAICTLRTTWDGSRFVEMAFRPEE
ncbi:hypothetical protein [Azospirillum himalayense]|uniref:Uncharacterized protein n=1 Tax=Azospirillum himalayense TaxID=654847 RepID=A0ABW0FZ90_9PROT